MNKQELSDFDGREGRPAYVAIGGTVYDLSSSERWVNGLHEGVHQAGQDLTEALKSAPHVRSVIERFPVIDRLTEPSATHPQPGKTRLPLYALLLSVLLLVLLALFR
jgi:predicted heme/steroid binding protein